MRISTPKYNWQEHNFGTISLCMIMKNEAKRLPRCLKSVEGLVNEIIIVDTGSTDNSIEIAEAAGATVIRDPWQDDFARPRNIGLTLARMQWILIMDPDETIFTKDHINLKWLTRYKSISAFWLTTLNYGNHSQEQNYRFLPNHKDPLEKFPGYTPSTKTRFFRNGLGIKFEGCFHELVDWYLVRKKIQIVKCKIPIHHWAGEIIQSSSEEKRKFYLRLAEKKVREWPQHGQARWELAVAEMISSYNHRALKTILEAIKLGFAGKRQFFALARLLRTMGDSKTADFAFEKGICNLFPSLTNVDDKRKPLDGFIKTIESKLWQ